MQWLLRAEIPVNDIVGNFTDIAFVRMIFFFRTLSEQSKLLHDPLDTLMVHLKTTVQKLTVHSPYAVPFLVLIKDVNDLDR